MSLATSGKTLLTIAEICDELAVSKSTFYDWRAKGAAPDCLKLPNGALRVHRAAYTTWLDSCGLT